MDSDVTCGMLFQLIIVFLLDEDTAKVYPRYGKRRVVLKSYTGEEMVCSKGM